MVEFTPVFDDTEPYDASSEAPSRSSAPPTDGSFEEVFARQWIDFTPMWDDVEATTVPTMLVLGGECPASRLRWRRC